MREVIELIGAVQVCRDYYTRRDPERTRRNAVNQLQRLGYQVILTPAAASA